MKKTATFEQEFYFGPNDKNEFALWYEGDELSVPVKEYFSTKFDEEGEYLLIIEYASHYTANNYRNDDGTYNERIKNIFEGFKCFELIKTNDGVARIPYALIEEEVKDFCGAYPEYFEDFNPWN